MQAEELGTLLCEAKQVQKYVWLKHRLDRTPQLGTFTLDEYGTIDVALYLSFINDHEGLLQIRPEDVEWAHISNQDYIPAMKARLSHAAVTATLVRIRFSDFLKRQLFRFVPPILDEDDWHTEFHSNYSALGHFVQEETLFSDPEISRVPIGQLLSIENTDIRSDSVIPREDFIDSCCDWNLRFYHEDQKRP